MTSVYELKIGAEKLEVLLAIGEELTTLANTLNAAKEKLSQIANGNDDALKSLAELKKEILVEQEKINAILSAANEQASQTLAAAQSQAEQTANLAKEATEQNAESAKSAQQKAAEILASIEKLQEQIKATADKVENAGTLLTELSSLKEQIKTLLQNGIINDEAQSATQTYSSNLIEGKLATKASVGYGYSKIEANAKFQDLAQGINTAISAAAAAQSSADSKLGKDEQAADSAKLGGVEAEKFLRADVKSVAALGVGIGADGSDIAPSGNDLRVFSAKKGGKVILRGTGSDAVARDIKLNPSNAVIELGNFKFQGSLGGASAVFDQTALVPFFKADNLWRAVSFAKLASAVYDANKTEIAKELGKKLGKDEAASDSAKLIGVEGANFHRKDSANGSKITTITSLEVDLRQGDNFVLNPSAPGTLALKNGAVGQSGALIVRNATNITGYDAALGFRVVPTGLKATEVFAYFVVSENEIKIGRV